MKQQAKSIETRKFADTLRERCVDVAGKRLLISRLAGSQQEIDLSAPANCGGYGRIRHFRQTTSPGWPRNPLPIVPACTALNISPAPEMMLAQVFQNAACAWRCWYCFVPYGLLKADPERSTWLTATKLVELYRAETDRALIIDLSGGSPDLVPEWTVWMMEALEAADLDKTTYLWSDDNLSTTYLFDKLERADLDRIIRYRNYGRVCCFKGFDPESFTFNTRAAKADFDRQFEVMARLVRLGLDLFGYVTLTGPSEIDIDGKVAGFLDRLQQIDPYFPLRVVPLQIRIFSPVNERMNSARHRSLAVQELAIAAWNRELERRFDPSDRLLDISAVPLRSK